MLKKNCFFFLLLFLLCLSLPAAVLADDSSNNENTITLTINWIDDKPEDRPESITIELVRTVDDTETPMDSKTLTKSEFDSRNSWVTSFNYLYGNVWEYSFKITQVIPESGLYKYQFIESGNGTNNYTFDYIYGQGSTEMTIITHFSNVASDQRPDSVSIDLYSFNDKESPERSILTSGQGDTWTAQVSGLSDNPDNYYIVVTDLNSGLSSVVSKGDSSNVYINTISTNSAVTSEESDSMSESVTGLVRSIQPEQLNRFNGILGNLYLDIGVLILIGVVTVLAVLKHRKIIQDYKDRNEKDRN